MAGDRSLARRIDGLGCIEGQPADQDRHQRLVSTLTPDALIEKSIPLAFQNRVLVDTSRSCGAKTNNVDADRLTVASSENPAT
jgi:hypothetical protein